MQAQRGAYIAGKRPKANNADLAFVGHLLQLGKLLALSAGLGFGGGLRLLCALHVALQAVHLCI